MKSIKIEADDLSNLYSTVLIDTPIGPYFMKYVEMAPESEEARHDVGSVFKNVSGESLRTWLKKIWLEDFYNFCDQKLNPISAKEMKDLLNF